ncbi:MAG: zf-TFIIB domain-containing protein [Candidatus Krumholzibacteria bacterium]|nr:zf-TFIIB domain-containing protein [Candidatus Krumholzibacteria bacterium]
MKCPVCHVPTYVVEFEQIELDLCPDCQGIWFDHGELDLLLGTSDASALVDAESDEPSRPCPLCKHKMNKVNIGPGRRVLIDSCPEGCGIWFDKDELADLAGDLKADGWHVQPSVRDFLCGMFPTKGDE